ncbi:hypothetical protein EQG68_09475 [Flavobacterium piscinae]|uniref:Uncharacterized protein n=2 Tax=Flavobacterium piscinae TaxID=2506424 RepID=A0A4Q1KN88_9FLAO|nr:hypothetical protein [Flavobacterium piscinae]RXR31481.1 hypothetical protein EQG68_09475 [Flavobacterium piscinae]
MRIISLFLLLFSNFVFAQNGYLINSSYPKDFKIHLNKSQTHGLIWYYKASNYGLVYDLKTGEQVKEIILAGYTTNSSFEPHVFDYKEDNVILAGWDNEDLKPEHYFIWDEASNKFYTGKELPFQHGKIQDIIGDELVYAFTIYQKDGKGRLNLKKPSHSFVQFYNWKTKKWREFKQPYEFKENLTSRSLLLFEDGNKMKFFDLKTAQFLAQTTPAFDVVVSNYADGITYAAKYDKGIDKVALFDINTLTLGSFKKAPTHNNLDYYWGEMVNYHVKFEQNNTDIDLVITDKFSKATKKVTITTSDKEKADLIKARIATLKEIRQNKIKGDLDKKYASQKPDFVEFEANFEPLPKTFTYDYNNARGRDITQLKLSRKLFLTPNTTVFSVGKVFECKESKVFLVMLRGPQAEGTESVYAILKTDHYGNRLQYQIIARAIRNHIGYLQRDEFSITTNSNSNSVIKVKENYMGEEKSKEFKIYCLN